MRRDHLAVDVSLEGDDDDPPPTLRITLADTTDASVGDLLGATPESIEADDLDVALRRGDDGAGVISIARRLTGEYLLEANVSCGAIEDLVSAAAATPGETRYRLLVEDASPDGIAAQSMEKRTLLVYDSDGNLERETSLIPSGVEL